MGLKRECFGKFKNTFEYDFGMQVLLRNRFIGSKKVNRTKLVAYSNSWTVSNPILIRGYAYKLLYEEFSKTAKADLYMRFAMSIVSVLKEPSGYENVG